MQNSIKRNKEYSQRTTLSFSAFETIQTLAIHNPEKWMTESKEKMTTEK